MIGKSTHEDYQDLLEPVNQPLARVNMDLYSSSVTSIEGYNYALLFTDEYRWQYGLKTNLKDEVLQVSKRWFAEIAYIRQRFPLLSVVRDKARENTSKLLFDFYTENGVKNYFSTPYEQWQIPGKMDSLSHQ